jgi:hypothetical protein
MAATFISYRREDSAGYAGRLHESLERRLGAAQVFRDVDTLRPGQDYVKAIEQRLAACRVMLVIIGREWLDARAASGGRRLDEPYDLVRLEIAAGLARPDVLVVPVLVEGASMPDAAALPESIRPLARRHAATVRDETWDADIDRLIAIIDEAAAPSSAAAAAVPRLWRMSKARPWLPMLALLVAAAALASILLRNRGTDQGPTLEPGTTTRSFASPALSTPAFAAYAIDVPRVAEAAFGSLIYTVVAGNVVSRGDANELRLRMRLSNSGRSDETLEDRSFRLAAGDGVAPPTGGLHDPVPRNSLRYGIVTFRLSPRTTRAVLHILYRGALAEIPLDLTPTGRPAGDEQADVPDSLSQALVQNVADDEKALFDGPQVAVTLARASSRRFANALRLNLSVRIANRGRSPIASGQVVVRVAAGDLVTTPLEMPNQVIATMETISATLVFDLPPSTTQAVIRTSFNEQVRDVPVTLN